MAYPIASGAILELAFDARYNGQQILNLLHYRFTTGSSIADGAQAALEVIELANELGQLKDAFCDAAVVEMTDIYLSAQWIKPNRYRAVIDPTGPYIGNEVAAGLPQNVAVVITKYAEEATRHGIGSFHMAGVPVSWVTEGKVDADGLASYVNLADELTETFVLAGGQVLEPVIFQRNAPAASLKLVEASVQLTTRVMRRRTVGVGA